LAGGIILFIVAVARAEDPAERDYHVPALDPQHAPKPKVEGWASKRVEETLDRGLNAMPLADGKVYLSWRLLKGDPPDVTFDVYRSVAGSKEIKLNAGPVATTTDYIDVRPIPGKPSAYRVRSSAEDAAAAPAGLMGSAELEADAPYRPYCRTIEFRGDYQPQRIGVGDLNGDGAYDFVIKQPSLGIDPAGTPNTDGLTYKLEAYLNDGKFIWRHDLGLGIEPGIWYSPFVVFDFDGDGKAEVAAKIGPNSARLATGRVLEGPEWCAILDGETGRERARADWPPRDARYGDYNRANRNQMGVAFLDGRTPFLLAQRGVYKLMVLDAFTFYGGELTRVWRWDGDEESPMIRSQGADSIHSADIDGDGRDEVILGSVAIDDDGTALWSTGYGSVNKCFVTDVDPARPGLEILYTNEPSRRDGNGICLVDARTGETIWNVGRPTRFVRDAMVADIDADRAGLESFAIEDPVAGRGERHLLSARGERIAEGGDVPNPRDWIYWDDDLLRETVGQRRTRTILKHNGATLMEGIEGRVIMIADIMGDWREELITILPGELRIYATTIPARDRRVCLMQDPVYRADVAHRSMGYEQSPVTGYYLGMPVNPATTE
jgi:rhamnogalacturonan endolyase